MGGWCAVCVGIGEMERGLAGRGVWGVGGILMGGWRDGGSEW